MAQEPTAAAGTVGATIHRTVRYVARTLLDVHAVLNVAESHINERGWWPLKGNKLTGDADNFNQPESWIVKIVGRAYVNIPERKSLNPVDDVRIVEVHLAPDFASEAMVVLAKAHLTNSTHRRDIWNSWPAYVGEILGTGIALREPFILDETRAKTAMTIADRIAVQVLPLTDVPSKAQVLDRIVDPLFNLP